MFLFQSSPEASKRLERRRRFHSNQSSLNSTITNDATRNDRYNNNSNNNHNDTALTTDLRRGGSRNGGDNDLGGHHRHPVVAMISTASTSSVPPSSLLPHENYFNNLPRKEIDIHDGDLKVSTKNKEQDEDEALDTTGKRRPRRRLQLLLQLFYHPCSYCWKATALMRRMNINSKSKELNPDDHSIVNKRRRQFLRCLWLSLILLIAIPSSSPSSSISSSLLSSYVSFFIHIIHPNEVDNDNDHNNNDDDDDQIKALSNASCLMEAIQNLPIGIGIRNRRKFNRQYKKYKEETNNQQGVNDSTSPPHHTTPLPPPPPPNVNQYPLGIYAHHYDSGNLDKWNANDRFLPMEALSLSSSPKTYRVSDNDDDDDNDDNGDEYDLEQQQEQQQQNTVCSIWEVGACTKASDSREFMKHYPHCEYHAYEPIPSFFQQLSNHWDSYQRLFDDKNDNTNTNKNINKNNKPRIYLHNYGIGKENRTFFVQDDSLKHQSTYIGDSLSMTTTTMTNNTTTPDSSTSSSQYHVAQIYSFDYAIQDSNSIPPTLLHLNCEGCEWEFIKDAIHDGFINHEQPQIIQIGYHNYGGDDKEEEEEEGGMIRYGSGLGNRVLEYCEIRSLLELTHDLVFTVPFGWERWVLKKQT